MDSNDQCIDFLDFGKEFKYNLKSDGSIVSKTMDKKYDIEEGC